MDTAANRCEWMMESTAEKTIGVLRAQLAATEQQLAAAQERAERAEEQVRLYAAGQALLTEALQRYGRHLDGCVGIAGLPCECGLHNALHADHPGSGLLAERDRYRKALERIAVYEPVNWLCFREAIKIARKALNAGDA